jgi:phospholipid/cholesterol/gamma-HCH transport system substrate-binding protein
VRSSKLNYVVVGLFVLVALAGVLVAVALLTGRTGASDRYHTVYDNVAGLKFGTPVSFEGYQIGQVEAIAPTQTDDGLAFRVELSVEQGFPIPRDSTAAIGSTGLLAGASVQITAGQAAETLQPGARIEPGTSADMFAAVANIAGQVNTLSEQGVQPLLEKLNRYTEVLGRNLTETAPLLLEDLRAATRSLADTTPRVAEDVEAFTGTLNQQVLGPDNLERIRATLRNLEAAARSVNEGIVGPENRAQIRATLGNLQQASGQVLTLTEELQATKRQIDRMVDRVDTLVQGNTEAVDKSLQDLQYTLDVVSQHVDAIAYNLESTSRNMNEFSRTIRRNPGVLLGGAGQPEGQR